MAVETRTRLMPRPIDEVWPVIEDFTTTYRWNPLVERSEPIGDQRVGLGAQRRCDLDDTGKKHIEERIVDFDADAHRYVVEIVGGTAKPPIRTQVEFVAEAAGAAATSVTMTAHLMADSMFTRLIAPIGARQLGKVADQVLEGLAGFLENEARTTP